MAAGIGGPALATCNCARLNITCAHSTTTSTIRYYLGGGGGGFASPFDRLSQAELKRLWDEKRVLVQIENKENHRQFMSKKAGLPHMFRKWYR